MKYGCGTTIDNYSILQALGFDYIELPGNQISQMTDDEFDALKTILEADSEIQVCGSGKNGKEAVSLYDSLHPDILLMDIRMEEAANYIFLPLASAPPNPENFRKATIWKKHGKKQKHS